MTDLTEFDYPFDKKFIAQKPLPERDKSKMMVLYRKDNKIIHSYFYQFPYFIDDSYILVLNNSKVFPAKLIAFSQDKMPIDILLIKEVSPGCWEVLAKPLKRLRKCKIIKFADNDHIAKVHYNGMASDSKPILEFSPKENFFDFLNKYGKPPIPPYIKRKIDEDTDLDKERYQTIYATELGSIAAPTAGFHFTQEILNTLSSKGIEIHYITLHVGIGTFKPIRCKEVEKHNMEPEYFEIKSDTLQAIKKAKREGKKILAVGTTTTRALESMDLSNPLEKDIRNWTNLFIYPGHNFKIVDALLTNFHLPKSTLLVLVSAFAGKDFILKAYQEAMKNNYRFYSYGDCMLIL